MKVYKESKYYAKGSKYKHNTGADALIEKVIEGRKKLLSFDSLDDQNAYDKWLRGKGPRPDFVPPDMIENLAPGLRKKES